MVRWILRLLALTAALMALWFYAYATPSLALLAYRAQPVVVFGNANGADPGQQEAFDSLAPDGKQAFLVDFPKSQFFAAFAASADGRYGWVSGRHNPDTARVGALSRCGDGCLILVELQPEGYDPLRPGQTVSEEAAFGAITDGAEIYYALAANGVWAVQQPEDGRLPKSSVLDRCRNLLGQTPTAGSVCTVFHGPVQIIQR